MPLIIDSPFIRLVSHELGPRWRKLLGVASIAGLADGAVVTVINISSDLVEKNELSIRYLVIFLCLMGIDLFSRYFLLSRASDGMEEIIHRMRMRISERLAFTELSAFDRLNGAELQLRLSQGTTELSSTSLTFFSTLSSACMLVFCGIYMSILSIPTFLCFVALNIAFAVFWIERQVAIQGILKEASQTDASFYNTLNQLIRGFKEVKMNERRRDAIFQQHLTPLSAQCMEKKTGANDIFVQNYLFPTFFFYLLIALIIYILPTLKLLTSDAAGDLTALVLFTSAPISQVVLSMNIISRLDISVEALEKIERLLETSAANSQASSRARLEQSGRFSSLEFQQVCFDYRSATGETDFRLGPLNFTLHRGDLLFIRGGNGSGKSTFLKVLAGLYLPSSGRILFNGVPIDRDNISLYRSTFATIFSDFHLFDRLYGLEHISDETTRALIQRFGLEEKTDVQDGRFTHLELSTGQRKRLALITALLEERQIYILDEVASDQDPAFRGHYYEVLLEELRQQDKTLVVVSHDDTYFHIPDRLIRMSDGQFSEQITFRSHTAGSASQGEAVDAPAVSTMSAASALGALAAPATDDRGTKDHE